MKSSALLPASLQPARLPVTEQVHMWVEYWQKLLPLLSVDLVPPESSQKTSSHMIQAVQWARFVASLSSAAKDQGEQAPQATPESTTFQELILLEQEYSLDGCQALRAFVAQQEQEEKGRGASWVALFRRQPQWKAYWKWAGANTATFLSMQPKTVQTGLLSQAPLPHALAQCNWMGLLVWTALRVADYKVLFQVCSIYSTLFPLVRWPQKDAKVPRWVPEWLLTQQVQDPQIEAQLHRVLAHVRNKESDVSTPESNNHEPNSGDASTAVSVTLVLTSLSLATVFILVCISLSVTLRKTFNHKSRVGNVLV